MLKAEIGDFLYYIIVAVLMIVGIWEKIAKAKKQQQGNQSRPPVNYDDFDNVDSEQPSNQAPPKTIEEMMRRMMQTLETSEGETETVSYPEEAQSLEVIPSPVRSYYQPIEIKKMEQSEIEAFSSSSMEKQIESDEVPEFEFDVRKAIIANEILNRKY